MQAEFSPSSQSFEDGKSQLLFGFTVFLDSFLTLSISFSLIHFSEQDKKAVPRGAHAFYFNLDYVMIMNFELAVLAG